VSGLQGRQTSSAALLGDDVGCRQMQQPVGTAIEIEGLESDVVDGF